MTAFDNRVSKRRFGRPHLPVLMVVLLAIGGVSFAATGGVEKLKRFIFIYDVRLEIDGQDGHIVLEQDDGVTVEVEGGSAVIDVTSVDPETGEESMQITANRITISGRDGDWEEGTDGAVIIKVAVRTESPAFDIESIGDTEPFEYWWDEQDRLYSAYFLPRDDEEGVDVVVVRTSGDGDEESEETVAHSFSQYVGEVISEFEEAEDGTFILRLTDAEGQENVIEIRPAAEVADPEVVTEGD